MKKTLFIIFSFFSFALLSQERGTITKSTTPKEIEGKNYIFSVGVDDYENWPKLGNAKNDAKGILELFVDNLGFQQITKPLYNKRATKSNILSTIENKLNNKLKENDNLIIVFAGHGASFKRKVGTREIQDGYIIPQDAKQISENNYNSYIDIEGFLSKINKLPAKHILVVLDACKSGMALKTIKTRADNSYSASLKGKMSRNIVTSAMADQVAADGGPIEGHSLFSGTLIKGFKEGLIDKFDRNGIVTSSEIGLYLQQMVAQNSKSQVKQTPDFGAFGYDDGGELIIKLNDDSRIMLQSKAKSTLRVGNYNLAWKLLNELNKKYKGDKFSIYLNYRKSIFDNDIDTALDHVKKMINLSSEFDFPIPRNELYSLKEVLPRWKNLLKINSINNKSYSYKVYQITNTKELENDRSLPVEKKEVTSKMSQEHTIYFPLNSGEYYQIEVFNKEDNNVFVNNYYTNANGFVETNTRLFNDWDVMDNGLTPNKSTITPLLLQDGAIGIEKISLILSNKRIRELEMSSSLKTRSQYISINFDDYEITKLNINLMFK